MASKRKSGKPRIVGGEYKPLTMSGFCAYPSPSSHKFCTRGDCTCDCHADAEANLG